MKLANLPLLALRQSSSYPPDKACPRCGRSFFDAGGFAYISAGALIPLDKLGASGTELSPEAFFNVGFHGSDVEVRDSVDAHIVDDLASDQFTISFCSLECLKGSFIELIDELQAALDVQRKAMGESDEA